jgi:hypothetical protein
MCGTPGQLDHFVALALQQNGEQSVLRKGRAERDVSFAPPSAAVALDGRTMTVITSTRRQQPRVGRNGNGGKFAAKNNAWQSGAGDHAQNND